MNYIIKKTICQILIPFFLFFLFFPLNKVFITNSSFLTGDYLDFTSFSLYLSDILIITLFIALIISFKRDFLIFLINKTKIQSFIILFSFFGIFVNSSENTLNSYILSKFALYSIVAYGTCLYISSKKANFPNIWEKFGKLCILLGLTESLIIFFQFFHQSPIGLFFLGEKHINPLVYGFAKIVVSGETLVRGYGTFPHPNVASAFLLITGLISLYYVIMLEQKKQKAVFLAVFGIIFTGIVLTFSRLSIFSTLIVIIFIFFGLIMNKNVNKKAIFYIYLVLASIIIGNYLIFNKYINARVNFSDSSASERRFYNITGLKMIINNPIFGIGAGESVLHMEQYSKKTLKPWEKQPPHNYFIAIAAEIGILPALLLLYFICTKIWVLAKEYLQNKAISTLFAATIGIVLLVLALFDHYFYTLAQTQILFWLVLAFLETKKPRLTMSE